MGIETIIGGLASGIGGSLVGGLLGGGGSSQSGNQTVTTKNEIDPRMADILFGSDGKSGLLAKYQEYLNNPQSPELQQYGKAMQAMLGGAASDVGTVRNALLNALNNPTKAPQVTAATGFDKLKAEQSALPSDYTGRLQNASTALVNTPQQNNLGLGNAYQNFIYGEPGANPYFQAGLQKSLNQAKNALGDMQDEATLNLTRNILPNVRSGAVASGQYGGSRQGIAEGTAIGDFLRSQQKAISQLGQNAQDTAAQAAASQYNNDRQMALSALGNLSGNQYNTASQNAQMMNQGNMFNANNFNNALSQMYQGGLQNNLSNANMRQNTNLANNQNQLANLQFLNNAASQNAQLQANNNALNSQNLFGLSSGLSSLGSNIFNSAQGQNDYGLNNAMKVNSLLAPYMGMGGSQTQTSPMYQNKGANILGGALMGNQLFGNLFGGGGGYNSWLNNNQELFNSTGLSAGDIIGAF